MASFEQAPAAVVFERYQECRELEMRLEALRLVVVTLLVLI
jgi:hypothetical protein